MKKRITWFVLAVVTSAVCAAETPSRDTERSATQLAETQTTTPEREESSIGPMRQWGIESAEYARYRLLMKGPRGAFSVANISPLEVLGIHARTAAERRAYADRLVRVLYEDTERVLAFEREVQAAWRRLGKPMFDPALVTARSSAPAPGRWAGKRLAVFVATQDCPGCISRTRDLAGMTTLAGLDVYVVDTNDATDIRAFAHEVGITREAVISRRVTLNKGQGLFKLYPGEKELPVVFVREGGQLHPLASFGEALR